MANKAIESNGSTRRREAMSIVLSNQESVKKMPLQMEMLHLAWYQCRCYQNAVLSSLGFLLASTSFWDDFSKSEWESLHPDMQEVFTTLILLVFDFSALPTVDPIFSTHILPNNEQVVRFAQILQRENPSFIGNLRDTYGNPENFLKLVLGTHFQENRISRSFFKATSDNETIFRVPSGNGGKQLQLQLLIKDAELEKQGNFKMTCDLHHQFVALHIIHNFEVPNKSFTAYLRDAYKGFPFVVIPDGRSHFFRKQFSDDVLTIKSILYDGTPGFNEPLWTKMIFIEMTRSREERCPFGDVDDDIPSLAAKFKALFQMHGLTNVLNVCVPTGLGKRLLMKYLPSELDELFPPSDPKTDLPLPHQLTDGDAASIVCFLMKEKYLQDGSSKQPCTQFGLAWSKYAKETISPILIPQRVIIGDINFRVCAAVQRIMFGSKPHFATHCVGVDSSFTVDDMEAETSDSHAHGISIPLEHKGLKVDDLVLIFACKEGVWNHDTRKPRPGIYTSDVIKFVQT